MLLRVVKSSTQTPFTVSVTTGFSLKISPSTGDNELGLLKSAARNYLHDTHRQIHISISGDLQTRICLVC